MASYTGEVLERFGRYEAIENQGPQGCTHLWRAWDPFLERFVVVAVLPGLGSVDLERGLRELDDALERWTVGRYRSAEQVLDFDPGDEDEPAFLVLRPEAGPRARRQGQRPGKRSVPEGRRRRALAPALILAGVGLLAVGGAAGFLLRSSIQPAFSPQALPDVAGERQPLAALEGWSRRADPTPGAVGRVAELVSARDAERSTALEPRRRETGDVVAEGGAGPAPGGPAAGAAGEGGEDDELVGPVASAPGNLGGGEENPPPEGAAPELRFDPPAGEIELTVGESLSFFVVSERSADLVCDWYLDGLKVGAGLEYRFRTADLMAGDRLTLVAMVVVSDGEALESAQWALAVRAHYRKPQIRISAPQREVRPGELVRLSAKVWGADIAAEEQFECEWAVDDQPLEGRCEEFEWRVPAHARADRVRLSLTARDQSGAWERKEVFLRVRPGPRMAAPRKAAARVAENEAVPPPVATPAMESIAE